MKDEYNVEMPVGFRFAPTDQELIMNYLLKKKIDPSFSSYIINEAFVYESHPQELIKKYKKHGENCEYFFSTRKRKYPNGSRPDRSAGGGFWKLNGKEEEIRVGSEQGDVIGYKRSLVFHYAKPDSSNKTNWLMKEYQMKEDPKISNKGKLPMQLDDWVLCKIYEFGHPKEEDEEEESIEPINREVLGSPEEEVDIVRKEGDLSENLSELEKFLLSDSQDGLEEDDIFIRGSDEVREKFREYYSECEECLVSDSQRTSGFTMTEEKAQEGKREEVIANKEDHNDESDTPQCNSGISCEDKMQEGHKIRCTYDSNELRAVSPRKGRETNKRQKIDHDSQAEEGTIISKEDDQMSKFQQ